MNLAVGTAPAGAVGALLTLAVHLLVSRLRGHRLDFPREVGHALVPYLVLLVGVVSLSAVVRVAGQTGTSWRYLASPALWLAIATAGGLRRGCPGLARAVWAHTVRTWLHAGPATVLFIVLGVLMAVSGMSAHLAAWLSGLGHGYLAALPFLAALGGFVTGSNSGANAMFAAPQAHTVTAVGADLLPAMAAHNVSSSLLTMASPARVELAVRLCPDHPESAPVQHRVLLVDVVLVACVAAVYLVTTIG